MLKNTHPFPIPSCSQINNLQINLFPTDFKSSQVFSAKLASDSIKYLELELFKQRLLEGTQPFLFPTYSSCYSKVRSYRAVFFGMSLLFLGLAGCVLNYNLVFFTVFFGNVGLLAKGLLLGTSLFFSLISLWMGYSLCVAKEAAENLAAKIKCRLTRLYHHQKIKHGAPFLHWRDLKKLLFLRHKYREALLQIESCKNETVYLLQKVQSYSQMEASYREVLFNQALSQMNDKLELLLENFSSLKLTESLYA